MKYASIPERSLDPPAEAMPVTTCPGCGEGLYEGDKYYPDWDACEFCIRIYEKRVSA